jgi:hypothetical protein
MGGLGEGYKKTLQLANKWVVLLNLLLVWVSDTNQN